jgi:hypothetical protein
MKKLIETNIFNTTKDRVILDKIDKNFKKNLKKRFYASLRQRLLMNLGWSMTFGATVDLYETTGQLIDKKVLNICSKDFLKTIQKYGKVK